MLKNDYYRICLRHMRQNDNVFTFWGENSSGYSKCIEKSGLYENGALDLQEQIKDGDFFVHKSMIDKLKQKVRLPIYGDKEEQYAGLNEFFVLPNTGQIRKTLGITILNIPNQGSNHSFDAYFSSSLKEKLKYEYSKTHYHVKGKEYCFNEYWFYDIEVEAKTRNEAILKAQKEWFLDEYSYLDFKKMVTCTRVKNLVFDKWESKV
ncbi:hypothetical protein ACNSOL_12150 (plasmid) [Aliarcobacter lanthieri]|uniref:hypothetical protein n=1 Tax=Aliarcobacter lanthieri TaxID=1355374 RepID=UPI003AAF2991